MRYNIFSNSNCPILNIQSIGYAYSPHITHFGPGVRNSYIIHYVISGKGYFNGNAVTKGQGFLITPGMQENYFADKTDPWEFLWIISDDEKAATVFYELNADNVTNIFSFNYIDALKNAKDVLIKNNKKNYNGYEMLELFLSFFKYQQNSAHSASITTNADLYIKSAERYIELNLQENVTIEELTRFLGISQPYLFRIFKTQFSISPKQYIMEQKFRRAKKLLTETDLSITHIANSVGFNDVLAFSKFFKSKANLSPQNYRQQTN